MNETDFVLFKIEELSEEAYFQQRMKPKNCAKESDQGPIS